MKRCPICEYDAPLEYGLKTIKGQSSWTICKCGALFQKEYPKENPYTEKWYNEYAERKTRAGRVDWWARVYCVLVEDITYGRKYLDVGFGLPETIRIMRERGWITEGIDNNAPEAKDCSIIKADFEKHDFLEKKYDFINMGHVLECFRDPVGALIKAYDLLNNHGVMLITTPDVEIMYTLGFHQWGYWNEKEHYIYFSMRTLLEHLKKIGFNIVMQRNNLANRFLYTNDMHILVQKPFTTHGKLEQEIGRRIYGQGNEFAVDERGIKKM